MTVETLTSISPLRPLLTGRYLPRIGPELLPVAPSGLVTTTLAPVVLTPPLGVVLTFLRFPNGRPLRLGNFGVTPPSLSRLSEPSVFSVAFGLRKKEFKFDLKGQSRLVLARESADLHKDHCCHHVNIF